MAVLNEFNRAALWAEFQRADTGALGAVSKADLRAAVNALDDFLDTNAATINSAIPQPARAELTVKQKALLLMFVIARRYSVET